MSPEEVKAFAGVAGAPLVVALVEMTKAVFPALPARFWPTLALAWAEALNLFLGWQLGANLFLAAFAGLVTALVAMKFYDAGPSSSATPGRE